MRHALVTGGAGFIGSHLIDSLLQDEWRVTALDNFDPFYGRETKEGHIASHRPQASYSLIEASICDQQALDSLTDRFDVIVHLAARAGVRPSIADPSGYQTVNVSGTQQMLELARIDDAQSVHVPPHGIAGFCDPPVMIFAETNNGPVES